MKYVTKSKHGKIEEVQRSKMKKCKTLKQTRNKCLKHNMQPQIKNE